MAYHTSFIVNSSGNVQTDGPVVLDTSGSLDLLENSRKFPLKNWQIQFGVFDFFNNAVRPDAGTVTIGIKSPGAAGFVDFPTPVDLVNGSLATKFTMAAEAIRITPTGLDTDKSFSIDAHAS